MEKVRHSPASLRNYRNVRSPHEFHTPVIPCIGLAYEQHRLHAVKAKLKRGIQSLRPSNTSQTSNSVLVAGGAVLTVYSKKYDDSPTVIVRPRQQPSTRVAEVENARHLHREYPFRKRETSQRECSSEKQKPSRPEQVAERPKPKIIKFSVSEENVRSTAGSWKFTGKIDGIIGVKTRLAIRGWQTRNGYLATGAIDQSQIAKLEESAIQYLKEKKSKPKQIAKRPTPKKAPNPQSGSTGSGFFVSKLGHILTNEHVVRQCGSVTVGDNANKQVSASVLDTDKRNDLALLRISSTKRWHQQKPNH